MSIQPIDGQANLIQAMQRMQQDQVSIQPNHAVSEANSADRVEFVEAFKGAIKSIDAQQHVAAGKAAAVETGRSDDLIGAMIAGQKAGLSFDILLQSRNRLMTGVDKIMNMAV